MDLNQFKNEAQSKSKANKLLLKKLGQMDTREVDDLFHTQHEEVFAEMDCLTCANCCKTTSPIFYQGDVERAAKAIRIRPGEFVERYLRTDEDGDMVLRTAPCPFLDTDNRCKIYDSRPKACREYPHTDRKKMVQIMDLTYRNTLVCPAVLRMVDGIRRSLEP